MNNIQRGHVTCYICWIQALAPQFSNSPWTGTKRKAQEKLVDAILPVQMQVTTIADEVVP
jgi:hypothetical protein